MHARTHRVQEATECRTEGVRLQEQSHPKHRLFLSLFNRWLEQLFEGPFNCCSDRAFKSKRDFFLTSFIDFSSYASNKNAHTALQQSPAVSSSLDSFLFPFPTSEISLVFSDLQLSQLPYFYCLFRLHSESLFQWIPATQPSLTNKFLCKVKNV